MRVLQLFKRYDAIGFLTIGGLSTLLNVVMFAISLEIGISLYFSVAIGNLFATAAYFLGLSKLFSGPGSISSIARFLLTVVAYYFISIALLDVLNFISENVVLNRIVVIVLIAPFNYFAQKYFVFRN